MNKKTLAAQQERFQTLLRNIRIEADLQQVGLSKLLGKPQSFISKCESGERRLDLVELRQICKAVGITLEEFAIRFKEMVKHLPN